MKRWLPLLIVLMLMSRGSADEPTLPRDLGFRTAGQPETAKQMREDLWYVRQGVDDADFDRGLKEKLSALIDAAERGLDAAKDLGEAGTIRDRVEREATTLLTVEQRQQLRRRTIIAFAELLILNSGFPGRDIDGDVVATFGLTAEQADKIRSLLDRMRSAGGANPADELSPAEVRRRVRAVLSPKQRELLDQKIETALKAARDEVRLRKGTRPDVDQTDFSSEFVIRTGETPVIRVRCSVLMTPGIYLFHKPVGPTSFSLVQEVIRRVQSAPGAKGRARVCHGGTLDPFAHGLLLMLVGSATKLFDYLHSVPKVYEATVRWGVETDNGDPGGKPVFSGDTSGLTPARLDEALASFIGWHEQTPPATSAKRVGGERAYLKAHRGETVEMPIARVYLHEAQWLAHDLPRSESRLRIVVRGGYYVRALARDLGRALGCAAHLTALRRTAIGPWEDPGEGREVEIHGRQVMPWTRSRIVSDFEVGELRAARTIATREIVAPEWPMPSQFIEAGAPIRAFHLGKLIYLLSEAEGRLGVLRELRGGV